MSRRHPRPGHPSDDSEPVGNRTLADEFDKLIRETATDSILDALERDLSEWGPAEDEENQEANQVDRLNRQIVAKSIFREKDAEGYHEDMTNIRPMESEVRRGLAELKDLINEGKPLRRR